jgi:hypothetical protein
MTRRRTTISHWLLASALAWAALGVIAFCPYGAAAQDMRRFCGQYSAVTIALDGKYGERLMTGGYVRDNVVVEFWMNATTGTWTILSRGADGSACVQFSGKRAHAGASWSPFGEEPEL